MKNSRSIVMKNFGRPHSQTFEYDNPDGTTFTEVHELWRVNGVWMTSGQAMQVLKKQGDKEALEWFEQD